MGGLEPISLETLHESCAEVASETAPFTVTLSRIAKGSTFFQSVFGLFDSPSTQSLKMLHQRTRTAIARLANVSEDAVDPTPAKNYTPHVSFVYGTFSECCNTKDIIVKDVYKALQEDAWALSTTNNTALRESSHVAQSSA